MGTLFSYRGLIAVIGLICVYAGTLLYEDEDGRLQNRLEEWWCRLDDTASSALHVNLRILKGLAREAQGRLDAVLGKKLVSIQSIGVLICWGMISAKLTVLIVAASGTPISVLVAEMATILIWFFLSWMLRSPWMAGAKYLNFGTVASLWAVSIVAAYVSGTAANIVEGPPRPTIEGQEAMRLGLAVLPLYTVGVIISILIALGFVVISRWSLRRVARSATTSSVIGSAALHGAFLLAMVSLHVLAAKWLVGKSDLRGYLFQITTPIMGEAYFTSLLYVAFLAHAVFWGVIQRPVYALQRIGGERRKKLLTGIGVLLLAAALAKDAGPFKSALAVFKSLLS